MTSQKQQPRPKRRTLPDQIYSEYRGWIREHCWPVTAALNSGNVPAANAALSAARTAIEALPPASRLADSYLVACLWHEYLVESKALAPGTEATFASEFIRQAAIPRSTEWGEQCRLKVSLCIRLSAASIGAATISGVEIRSELAQIDDLENNAFVWHYVCPWAFVNRDGELLGMAYEALVHDSQAQGQRESFLRVGLLYTLVIEKATQESVRRYLEHVSTQANLVEFLRYILPECEAQGLVNEELRAVIEARQKSLELKEREVARTEKP